MTRRKPSPPLCGRIGISVVMRFAGMCLAVSFLLLPALWCSRLPHSSVSPEIPLTTKKASGIHGDPVNIALVGTWDEVVNAMTAAGWYPSDRLAVRTAAREVECVLMHRRYDRAPVSNLYLWGRSEDMTFEQPAARSPQRRHHARFWRAPLPWKDGRQLWVGAATFDHSVGLSHYTGQITHHIDPNVDAERNKIINDLRQADLLEDTSRMVGVGPTVKGKNGEGDAYYTDGDILVGIIRHQQ